MLIKQQKIRNISKIYINVSCKELTGKRSAQVHIISQIHLTLEITSIHSNALEPVTKIFVTPNEQSEKKSREKFYIKEINFGDIKLEFVYDFRINLL